jgi:hypothetical protein
VIRRRIVVVHGIGHQQRGDQLDDVVEPMVEFLGEKLGRQNVQLAARTGRTDGHQATARIRVTPGTGEPDEEWDVREAWWAQTFKPSDDSTVLGWAVRAFVAHIASTWQNVFLRNIKRLAGKHVPVQGLGEGVWQIPVSGLYVYYLIDAFAWLLITVGYLLVYVAGAVLIVPLYVFLLLPGEKRSGAGASTATSIGSTYTPAMTLCHRASRPVKWSRR